MAEAFASSAKAAVTGQIRLLYLILGLIGVAAIAYPHGLCGRFFAMMRNEGMYLCAHFAFRLLGLLVIVRVKHRDHGYRTSGIAPRPVTLDECALHGFPVLVFFLSTAFLNTALLSAALALRQVPVA